jgi:hypothetical protein
MDERTFAAAWALGRKMTPEQVRATQGQAMVSPPTMTATTPTPTYPAGLTAREVEVLRLVAKGLTKDVRDALLMVFTYTSPVVEFLRNWHCSRIERWRGTMITPRYSPRKRLFV